MTTSIDSTRRAGWFEAGEWSGDPVLDDSCAVASDAVADVWHNEDKTEHACWWVTVTNAEHTTRFYFSSVRAADLWRSRFAIRIEALASRVNTSS